jgi:hypothetical protein
MLFALVVQVGGVVMTLEFSPFTNPVACPVTAGTGLPYTNEKVLAVMVNGAGCMVNVPLT